MQDSAPVHTPPPLSKNLSDLERMRVPATLEYTDAFGTRATRNSDSSCGGGNDATLTQELKDKVEKLEALVRTLIDNNVKIAHAVASNTELIQLVKENRNSVENKISANQILLTMNERMHKFEILDLVKSMDARLARIERNCEPPSPPPSPKLVRFTKAPPPEAIKVF